MHFESEEAFRKATYGDVMLALSDFKNTYDCEFNADGALWIGQIGISEEHSILIIHTRTSAEVEEEIALPLSYMWCPDWVLEEWNYRSKKEEEERAATLKRTMETLRIRKDQRYREYLKLKAEFEPETS